MKNLFSVSFLNHKNNTVDFTEFWGKNINSVKSVEKFLRKLNVARHSQVHV